MVQMHSRLLRITIKNLLSFKDIAVELGGLNVLVGENASGKSNFLKALRLLKLLSHGSSLGDAVKSLGFSSERDVIFSQEENLEALLLLEADIDGVQYEYELRFKPGRIISELLKAEGLRLIERRDASGEYLSLDERMISYSLFPGEALLGDVAKRSDVSERIRAFHHFVESWGFYSFEPRSIRGDAPISYSLELSYDGSNLPQVLHSLLTTERSIFMNIEDAIRSSIRGIREILLLPGDGRVQIAVREEGFRDFFRPGNISDGTLRILAFTTALYLPSALIGFEEPENCVHPHLLGTLMDILRGSGKQVVISTHSPYLLDHVEPDDVFLVTKEQGKTRIERLAKKEQVKAVKKFLEEGGTLGEAWTAGMFES